MVAVCFVLVAAAAARAGAAAGAAAWAGDIPKAINESAMPTMSVPRPTREVAFR